MRSLLSTAAVARIIPAPSGAQKYRVELIQSSLEKSLEICAAIPNANVVKRRDVSDAHDECGQGHPGQRGSCMDASPCAKHECRHIHLITDPLRAMTRAIYNECCSRIPKDRRPVRVPIEGLASPPSLVGRNGDSMARVAAALGHGPAVEAS